MSSAVAVAPPSATHADLARERLAGLATPPGALGRLGDLAVWVSSVQGTCPPRPLDRVRAVVLAGDHGVTAHGVSPFPAEVTALMVRAFADGTAGVAVLAQQHGACLRVLDIGVDADLSELPGVSAHKVRRGSGAIHLEDALTAEEGERALEAGARIAEEEVDAGADLLVLGDMGIGNTTPSAALVAAALGLSAQEVTGRGAGMDDEGVTRKAQVVQQALDRAGERVADPVDRLLALGSADLAAQVGFLARSAELGVPVLLDGVISVACALTAQDWRPGCAAWFAAGHRSPEPAQSLALEKLGLEPLLDLGLRLGEGSGAMAAVPLVRSAALVLGRMAQLRDVLPG